MSLNELPTRPPPRPPEELTLLDICGQCCSVVWIKVWSKSTMSTSFLLRCSRCWSSLPSFSAC